MEQYQPQTAAYVAALEEELAQAQRVGSHRVDAIIAELDRARGVAPVTVSEATPVDSEQAPVKRTATKKTSAKREKRG